MVLRALLIFLVFSGAHASAMTSDKQFWGQVTAQGAFASDSNWGWFGEYQERYSNNQSRVFEKFIRPAISYRLPEWGSVSVGYLARFNSASQHNEDRIWQQWAYRWQHEPWNLSFRWRQEQRNLRGESQISHRSRWMLRAQYANPLWHGFSPFASCELFFNWNHISASLPAGIHQSRTFAGVNYQAATFLSFDLAYLAVLTFRNAPAEGSSDDTLWLAANFNF